MDIWGALAWGCLDDHDLHIRSLDSQTLATTLV
jgi:hypothetical protein